MPNSEQAVEVKMNELITHLNHFNNPKILSYFETAAKELAATDAETNIKKLLAIASGVSKDLFASKEYSILSQKIGYHAYHIKSNANSKVD